VWVQSAGEAWAPDAVWAARPVTATWYAVSGILFDTIY